MFSILPDYESIIASKKILVDEALARITRRTVGAGKQVAVNGLADKPYGTVSYGKCAPPVWADVAAERDRFVSPVWQLALLFPTTFWIFQREFSPLTASSYKMGRRASPFLGTSVCWYSDFALRSRLHFLLSLIGSKPASSDRVYTGQVFRMWSLFITG